MLPVPLDRLGDDQLKKLYRLLSHREREVIKLRYGLEYGYNYTPEQVGQIFKIPRERVLKIEQEAIAKAHRFFADGKLG